MNALLRAPTWSRKAIVAFAVLLAAVLIAMVATPGQETVSGAEPETDREFEVVGNGSLPTKAPKLGQLRDPLSAMETGYAIHLATTDASIPAGATNVTGAAGPEVLYADLPLETEGSSRQATVTLYDYTTNTLYNQLVDLKAGKVAKSTRATGFQPAPSSDEGDAAIAIAIAAEGLAFQNEFELAQGVPLVDPSQIEYVAGAFNYDGSTTAGKECGKDRCIQLFVQTASGIWLDTFDFVVNLSTKSVTKLK